MQTMLSKFYSKDVYMNGAKNGGGCRITNTTQIYYTWGMYGEFDMSYMLPAGRRLLFFTLLRDPMERLDSSYNYFCLDCAENGRQCHKARGENGEIVDDIDCPNMNLIEYAEAYQDLYVRTFGNAEWKVFLRYKSTMEDFVRAQQWIDRNKPYIIFTKQFAETGQEPFYELGEFLQNDAMKQIEGAPHSNSHAHTFSAPLDVIHNITATYFTWDYMLLRWIENDYVQPVAPEPLRYTLHKHPPADKHPSVAAHLR